MTGSTAQHDPLLMLIEQFRLKINAHPMRDALLRKWTPEVEVHARDTGERYTTAVRDGYFGPVVTGAASGSHVVLLEASAECLVSVFSGLKDSASAYFDGSLSVFASDVDHVRLDALADAVWGTA